MSQSPPLPPPPSFPQPVEQFGPASLDLRGIGYAIEDDGTAWVVWDLRRSRPVKVSVHPRTPEGRTAALRKYQRLDREPFYQRTGWWLILNLVIGLAGIAFALGVFATLVAEAAGRDSETAETAVNEGMLGLTLLVAALAGTSGWLLFCYLPTRRARWIGFLVTIAVGAALASVFAIAAYPPKIPD